MADDETQRRFPGTTPPRVLHVADTDVSARFGRMFRQLGFGLATEGLRVSFLTDDPRLASDLDGTPVECLTVKNLTGWWSWGLIRQLGRRLDPPPQLVHLWGTRCLRTIGRWAASREIPVLVHATSVADVECLLQLRRPWVHTYWAAACRGLVSLALSHSREAAEWLTVLPPVLLMPDPPAACQTEEHVLGVVWTGRLDPQAGLETLVDAVAQCARHEQELQVALIGTGPGVQSVWERIRQTNAQHCITLVHEPRSWDQAMGGVDVYVVPARQAELSLAPLLAMALGKTVLASRDQVAEWFVDDRTCWQFTPGSAVELAYLLSRAVDGDRRVQRLGESATSYVREHHMCSAVLPDLLTAYEALLRDSGSGGPLRLESAEARQK
ncbi:MAG: glycosyltransferase family 4 protein [Phycisphaerae bacterium]|jgi:glycosyltransferase involved in cell wall biosynthesis